MCIKMYWGFYYFVIVFLNLSFIYILKVYIDFKLGENIINLVN